MVDEKRTVMTIRMSPETHRGVSIAAARAGKSVNAWVSDVLEAASTASNLYALADQLRTRKIVDLTTVRECAIQASQLLAHLGIHLEEQVGELTDASAKLLGLLESASQAHQIREEREATK